MYQSLKLSRDLFIITGAIIIYLVTAWNSEGYYHPDEHYQIIEFAGLKSGLNYPVDLAWEYEAQMRSAIQPAVCYLFFNMLNGIGISDPYDQMRWLRILTACLCFAAIYRFIKSTLPQISPPFREAYKLLSWFLWFLPFINVRFSSETWSGIFLLLAVSTLQSARLKKNALFVCTGILLGISFLFRYQIAFAIAGLLGWLLLIKKEKATGIFTLLVSIVAVVQTGILIDYWFYGEYTLTAWNYFYTNIIQDAASGFGVSPWYFYFPETMKSGLYLIGGSIILAIPLLLFLKWDSMFVWLLIPFIVIHSVIPHKELRFLFPIANFIPVVLVLAWQEVRKKTLPALRLKILSYPLIAVFITINTLALLICSFIPAGNGTKEITRFIHDHYGNEQVNLIFESGSNPYHPWDGIGLRENFYKDDNITLINVNELSSPSAIASLPGRTRLLVARKSLVEDADMQRLIRTFGLSERKMTIPAWMPRLFPYISTFNEEKILVLYAN